MITANFPPVLLPFLRELTQKGSQTSSTPVTEKTEPTQLAFLCLQLTMETLKKVVKYIQS